MDSKLCSCSDKAQYIYNQENLCGACLVEKIESVKENGLNSYTKTEYYIHGEYIGHDDQFDEVIDEIVDNYNIERIKK